MRRRNPNDEPDRRDWGVAGEEAREERKLRRVRVRRRILRSTAILPAVCTILNGLSGFAAIHFATIDEVGKPNLANLQLSAWLIFVAMVFDVLDGRLARLTRRTSDFGAQLDSLCDVISFGVAPAVLMLRTVVGAFSGHVERVSFLPIARPIDQAFLCAAGVYVACAAMRLARFNVENEPDESAHMTFAGLPTPGAAAAVGSLVLLFAHLADYTKGGWRTTPWLSAMVAVTLPLVTLAAALLMVSRVRYPHVVNQYLRNRRPFNFLVKLVVVLAAVWVELYVTAAVVGVGFALSGPVGAIWHKVRPPRVSEGAAPPPA